MKKRIMLLVLASVLMLASCRSSQSPSTTAAGTSAAETTGAVELISSEASGETTEVTTEASSDAESNTAEETRPAQEHPEFEAGIYDINKYGNIILTVGADSLKALGYEAGDIVRVTIGNAHMDMPIATNYSDVDSGEPVCCMKMSTTVGREVISLAINGGDLTTTMGFAQKKAIDVEPGFEWVFIDGLDKNVPVRISMLEKQGYAEFYAQRQVFGARTNNREDYANLSDAEYANFRAVNTSGMGKDTLFRSSSPVDPALNRNDEADQAVLKAGIKTVMNMADVEETMKHYADYNLTYYSQCDIIALNMGIDITSKEFASKLADGFRFIASHDGPYLVHCKEGKDRGGYAAAILECLMGASVDEVVADYMVTYYNYYGLMPDSEQYPKIAEGSIEAFLAKAFGVDSVREEGVDLAKCAEKYLEGIGMTAEEIAELKNNLGKDYGGM